MKKLIFKLTKPLQDTFQQIKIIGLRLFTSDTVYVGYTFQSTEVLFFNYIELDANIYFYYILALRHVENCGPKT